MRREGEGSFPSLSLGPAAVLGRLSGGNRTLAGNLRNFDAGQGVPLPEVARVDWLAGHGA